MSLFDKASILPTGVRVPIGNSKPVTVLASTDCIGPSHTMDIADEYRLDLHIRSTFVANSAQYTTELRNAKKNVLHFLYRDVIEDIALARHAISYGSRDKALEALDEMRKKLTEV